MFSILLLFCLIAIVDSQSQCPPGFVANNILGCVLPPGTHATYDAALTSCQQLGATLPIIHNNNTYQALIAYIRTQSPFYFYWIGLRRRTGNLFIWSDQSTVDFQAWQPNRPTSNIGYDCVSMFAGSTDVGWRDSVCVDSNPYVCITPKLSSSTTTSTSTTTTQNGPCPGDTYSGSGFIQSPYYPSQYQNNADCQYHISVGSGQFVLLTIVQFQTEPCCDYLFLYNGPTISSPLLIRLSGTVSAGQQYESTGNQLTGRFSSDSSVTDVGFRINFNSTSVGPTTPTTPTQFPPTSPSPQCGRDFIYYPRDNLCFHWQYSLNTFDQANAICTGLNSTLASIHNAQVEQFLISYLINSTMNIDRWVTFIGLQTTVNGTFTSWTDGSSIDYTAWINGEPNTANGGCAVIQPYAPFGWHTWNCQTARPSLCMKRSM